MSLTFLTPVGALFALSALLLLAALALRERRLRRLRAALRLEQPSAGPRVRWLLALAAVPLLLGLALTQPVVRTDRAHLVRTDAQAFYVFDVSRSMLAASRPESATRFERATDAAIRMRTTLGSVPSGLASMTDRVVPHVFPTSDEEVFAAALAQSMRVNSPPPRGFDEVGTLFESLDAFAGTNMFDPEVEHRIAIVFTDGESREYYVPTLRDALAGGPHTDFVIVRFWNSDDRVWTGIAPDPRYSADPASEQRVQQLVSITGGAAFEEREVGKAIAHARELIGRGPVEERGEALRAISLSRWVALAALVPLGFVFWRRNVR